MFQQILETIKRIFNIKNVRKTIIEQEHQDEFVLRYKDITNVNLTYSTAVTLSNIVCYDSPIFIPDTGKRSQYLNNLLLFTFRNMCENNRQKFIAII